MTVRLIGIGRPAAGKHLKPDPWGRGPAQRRARTRPAPPMGTRGGSDHCGLSLRGRHTFVGGSVTTAVVSGAGQPRLSRYRRDRAVFLGSTPDRGLGLPLPADSALAVAAELVMATAPACELSEP
jgi:hypothetical protein